MKKIGISAGLSLNHRKFKNYYLTSVANNYVNFVVNSGGIPYVLPVINNPDVIEEQLKSLDAILLSGGEDCMPSIYGEETLSKCGVPFPERDEFDILLVKKAKELKIPIFGICRGAQILNAALGGTLYQDLSYIGNVSVKHDQYTNQCLATHRVKIEKDCFLNDLFGEELWVNSLHHQAVKDLSSLFKVIARSTDGVIEAFESLDKNHLILGLQWHPEMMAAKGNEDMIKIFKKFLNHL